MRYYFFFLLILNSVIAQQSIDDQKIFGVNIDDPWSNILLMIPGQISRHLQMPYLVIL